MEKKEAYKHILPHFQLPGQAYFVTFCLLDSVPPKALERYTWQLAEIKARIEYREKHFLIDPELTELKAQYNLTRKKYIKAFDDLLAQNTGHTIDLSKEALSSIIVHTLMFWNNRRLENYAWCIMPNHVHWVFKTRETDDHGKLVYLSDIMESIKKHTSIEINKVIGRKGHLWQKESFDTTIRDNEHLYNSINYTLNNPVSARFVNDWRQWPGCWKCEDGC